MRSTRRVSSSPTGAKLGQEVLAERDQARPVLVGEEHLAREEAVGAGVLAGDGLALGRARARRAERVLAIRGEPGGRRHRPAVYWPR